MNNNVARIKRIMMAVAMFVAMIVIALIILSYKEKPFDTKVTPENNSIQEQTVPQNIPGNSQTELVALQENQPGNKIDLESNIQGQTLDISLNSGNEFFVELPKYFQTLPQDTLLRIEFQDQNTNGIAMKEVFVKNGVYIPSEIDRTIKDIKMFIYKGQHDLAPSEAILISNDEFDMVNETLMKNWEEHLVEDMKKFILIGERYDLVKAANKHIFSDSTLFDHTRYINFTQDQAVSLNYTVGDEFILISNSFSIQKVVLEKLNITQ